MLDILSITGVIFVLIAVGYLLVRLGVFTPEEMKPFGKFVITIALPALVFRAVASRPVAEIANAGYMGAYLAGSLAVFALGYIWSRRLSGETAAASTFRAMGMSCSNSGFVGYPVLLMALPEIAPTALSMNMIVENLVMLPLVLMLAERSAGTPPKGGRLATEFAWRIVRNPIVVALALGMLASVSGIPLPPMITQPVDVLANASAALSLVVIGGTLATLPLSSLDRSVIPVVAGKLLLHPLAVGACLAALSFAGFGLGDETLVAAAILMASMPAMGIYPLLAQRFGEERSASIAMFTMTVLSFVTISAVMALVLP
jgi:malonate transporter